MSSRDDKELQEWLAEGYIPLPRKFFLDPLWKENRKFGKAEAWIDLRQLAKFKPSQEICGNQTINIPRGSLLTTIQELATRWSWGVHKTRTFLNFLKGREEIDIKTTNKWTMITLLNYEIYENEGQTN